ncbi:hypothetical protein [Leptospira stimsonii]|uniref:Uncharacterized protein n=1 Tax=Leptospira stimsonii TaxID=2202203 RepID=A0ABY2MY46_9LEPT|nr:hypothetical protein [Leptospira stimsonii]TGK14371.1 hypothetical protein EHO98_15945 [Leptospira stimsonii]TGM11734.1 hypothetical protein EHQ90_16120 [Leptospira stimsonii]
MEESEKERKANLFTVRTEIRSDLMNVKSELKTESLRVKSRLVRSISALGERIDILVDHFSLRLMTEALKRKKRLQG